MKELIINAQTGEMTILEHPDEYTIFEQVPEPQPTLEQRVSEIEQVTTEVITALNDKGIVP